MRIQVLWGESLLPINVKCKDMLDIKLGNIKFETIWEEDDKMLLNTFTRVEIKEVVWKCST